MFLRKRTSDDHLMGEVYSSLQKTIRRGDIPAALYWSSQIGQPYPNALRKRLCQNALEDASSLTFALHVLNHTPKQPTFGDLVPYVISLCEFPKTHSSAWLNRCAAQDAFEGRVGVPYDAAPDFETMDEKTYASQTLRYIKQNGTPPPGCPSEVAKLFKYVNDDPLAVHCWQLERRRPELASRPVTVDPAHTEDRYAALFASRLEVPDFALDKHTTRGKKLGRGYAHFFENMLLSPRVYETGDEPYEKAAKGLYLTKLLAGKEARVRHLMKQAPMGEVLRRDADIFVIPETAAGLGFKNATVVATRKSDGTPVFVKIGESPVDCAFAAECSRVRALLGMAHTQFGVEWCGLTFDYEEVAARANPAWAKGVAGKLKRAALDHADSEGRLPVQLAGVFEGGRLSDARAEDVDGEQLLQVLLFRKYVGSADTNAFNMMVGEEAGSVLSVDETRATGAMLERYATKGLVTSQSIRGEFLALCSDALVSKPREVRLFLERLEAVELGSVVVEGGRMEGVWGTCPFDGGTRRLLREAEDGVAAEEELRGLLAKLKLPPAGARAGGGRKRGRDEQ